jgi:DNA-3-methyladenine glycosylase
VEVEAYIGTDDRASHARFGETARNSVMFGPAGIAYVYLVYGMYDCLNVVTEPAGRPAAVLVRALEPLEGVEAMREARAAWSARRRRVDAAWLEREQKRLFQLPAERLTSGPGLVTAAMSIDTSMTGLDLCGASSRLRLERPPPGERTPDIVAGTRVGIRYAGEPWTSQPWRLALAGNPSVSAPPVGG